MLAFYLSLLTTAEDQDKFTRLYEAYWALMKSTARSYLRDKSQTEDAVHNAFLRILEQIKEIDEVDCHSTRHFVVVVVRNISIDMNRYERRHRTTDIEPLIPLLHDDSDLLDNMVTREIVELIYELPDIYRDVMEMKALQDMPTKRIATALGLTNATVRKRLERARAMLDTMLKARGMRMDRSL